MGRKFKFEVEDQPIRLRVEAKEPDEIRDSDLEKLISTLKNYTPYPLENLEGIALYLASCSQVTSSAISKTASEFTGNCKNLIFFELNLWGCSNVNDNLIIKIIEGIGNLTKLEHLNLFFKECAEISDSSVLSLSEKIHQLTNLKTFKLDLDSCDKITTDSAQPLMSTIGKRLKKLQTLELYFNDCPGIDDEGLSQLSRGFVDFNYLERLTLILSYTNTQGGGIRELAQKILRNLKQLKRFELGVYGIDISSVREEVNRNLKKVPTVYIYTD